MSSGSYDVAKRINARLESKSSGDECDDDAAVFTIDDAVEKIGFGLFHVKLALFAGVIFMADAMEVMVLSFLSHAAKCHFHLSGFEVAFISAVVFFGMLIGSQPYGWLLDTYGRRKGLFIAVFFLGLYGFLSAFSPSYVWLLILRFLVGVNLSAVPQALTYFLEFLPTQRRSQGVISISVWWSIGTIFEACLAMGVMPSLGWRYLLGLSACPVLLALLFFPFVPESPRFLMVTGQTEKAMQVLEVIAKSRGMSLPPGRLVLPEEKERICSQAACSESDLPVEVQEEAMNAVTRSPQMSDVEDNQPLLPGAELGGDERSNPFNSAGSEPESGGVSPSCSVNLFVKGACGIVPSRGSDEAKAMDMKVQKPTLRDLFSSREVTRSTLCVWWIWFSSAFVYYGIILITGRILSLQSTTNGACNVDANITEHSHGCLLTFDEYVEVMWTTVAEIPGLISAFVLLMFIGRRTALKVLIFGVTLCYGLLFLCNVGKIATLFIVFCVRGCVNGQYQVTFVYTPELYPTRSRAFGLSFCTFWARVGSIATSFVAHVVLAGSMTSGKIVYTALSFVSLVVCFLLPFETREKKLQ